MSLPFLLEVGTEEIPDWMIVPVINLLKCSNLFNLLDSRGAISVTERVAVIARVRKLAVGVAGLWVDQGTVAA